MEWEIRGVFPSQSLLGDLGSVIRFQVGSTEAPPENEFGASLASQNTSGQVMVQRYSPLKF